MSHPTASLVFVLAPAGELPADQADWGQLVQAQAAAIPAAWSLRIVSGGRQPLALPADPPLDGRLTAAAAPGLRPLCDATIPDLQPGALHLAVYAATGDGSAHWHQLDSFPLVDGTNETCWFYPTNDGAFLSWQRCLDVQLAPGRLVDSAPQSATARPVAYDRGRIRVLYSLLADDNHLTCVGLTYAGSRIDWPLTVIRWHPTATWSAFSVDTQADRSLTVHQRLVVPPATGT
ncbi:MAG: hypothetical protein ACK5E6_09770 [Cyanobacteriota bacterium]